MEEVWREAWEEGAWWALVGVGGAQLIVFWYACAECNSEQEKLLELWFFVGEFVVGWLFRSSRAVS